MTEEIACPSCHKTLYFPSRSEYQDRCEVLCQSCKHRYRIRFTEVLKFKSSMSPALGPEVSNPQNRRIRRRYDMRIQGEAALVESLTFDSLGSTERFWAMSGDRLIIVDVLGRVARLVAVKNATTQQTYCLFSPKVQSVSLGFVCAAILMGSGILLSSQFSGWLKTALTGAVVATSLGAGAVVWDRSNYRERNRSAIHLLSSEQQLLEQQRTVEMRLKDLNASISSTQQVIRRLSQLREDQSNLEGYHHRIPRIDQALTLMQQQAGLLDKLVSGYNRVLAMIKIEYETSRLAEDLPDPLETNILYLEEMKVLEDQWQSLKITTDSQALLTDSHSPKIEKI